MATTILDIAALAADLGKDNAARDAAKGHVISAEESATNTAFSPFFEGAEALNTPAGRTAVNIAYRMGYAGHLG